jgi:CheY-like chemotaxis protein
MKTILVVDDEQPIREMLQVFLQEEGYQALVAAHGQEGLERMGERLPDLVLCDVMMPVCDGREMVRRMRADPRTRAVPVILMSAGWPPAGIEQDHYVAVVSKPFDLFHLLDLIERALRRR